MKEFDMKNPFAETLQKLKLSKGNHYQVDQRSYGTHFFFLKKEFYETHLHDCYLMF